MQMWNEGAKNPSFFQGINLGGVGEGMDGKEFGTV
jgi:hypothetical protein